MVSANYAIRRNQNLTRTATNIQSGPISTMFMLIAMVVLLSLIYLNQVAKNKVFQYKLSGLQTKQTELSAQKKQLEIDASRLQAIKNLRDSEAVRAMVPVENVSYAR